MEEYLKNITNDIKLKNDDKIESKIKQMISVVKKTKLLHFPLVLKE